MERLSLLELETGTGSIQMRRWAVIPTGYREDDYLEVVEWCKRHNVTTVTIATSEEAREYSQGKTIRSDVLNISTWWSLGLNCIRDKMFSNDEEYAVAILNDDAVLPNNWFELMEQELSKGFSGASGLRHRNSSAIAGFAFCLNGRHDITPDEELAWYFTDDAIQRRCEEEGGFKVLPTLRVGNKYARSSEAFMGEQIEKDRKRYYEKYGSL